jgi:hypothetical protein
MAGIGDIRLDEVRAFQPGDRDDGRHRAEGAVRAMAKTTVSGELWEEFHRVVNMTSRELEEWLRVQSSGETAEALPDQAGEETSRRVLGILRKRRADLEEEDITVMESVVNRIRLERRDDLEPTAGEQAWRHRLMSLGHDPLKGPEVS